MPRQTTTPKRLYLVRFANVRFGEIREARVRAVSPAAAMTRIHHASPDNRSLSAE